MGANRLDEALGEMNRALDMASPYQDALRHRGWVYEKMKRFGEAGADYEAALRLNYDDSWTLRRYSKVILESSGDTESARSLFSELTKRDPRSAKSWLGLGYAQLRLHDEQAHDSFSRFVSLASDEDKKSPGFAFVLKYLAEAELAGGDLSVESGGERGTRALPGLSLLEKQ